MFSPISPKPCVTFEAFGRSEPRAGRTVDKFGNAMSPPALNDDVGENSRELIKPDVAKKIEKINAFKKLRQGLSMILASVRATKVVN